MMDTRSYTRRATGELAIDPALYELVMSTGRLVDRLICACPSPIPVAPEVSGRPGPRTRDPEGGPDAAGGP